MYNVLEINDPTRPGGFVLSVLSDSDDIYTAGYLNISLLLHLLALPALATVQPPSISDN